MKHTAPDDSDICKLYLLPERDRSCQDKRLKKALRISGNWLPESYPYQLNTRKNNVL
jgi:hypothetical protein